MMPEQIYFPGLESIPKLRAVLDDNKDAFMLKARGNCPIVISAPHAGSPDTTPGDAKSFGERQKDPSTKREPTKSDDTNTLKITFGVVRTLSAMGLIPNTVINLVSRLYMDLNRPWEGQVMWQDDKGVYRPGDVSKSAQDFPRVRRFRKFKNTYYQTFHDTLKEITTSLHPDGWLFDIHGRNFTEGNLILFSGYGYYARKDLVYEGPFSLHHYMQEQGFAVVPAGSNPANEVTNNDGKPTTNLISGGRYGARFFDPNIDPIPFMGNVIPNQPHRLHGIQIELESSLRFSTPDEALEGVGINIGYAIYNFLIHNRVIRRNSSPQSGENAFEWYPILG